LGFRVYVQWSGLGFKVQGFGFRVSGLRFPTQVMGLAFRDFGLGGRPPSPTVPTPIPARLDGNRSERFLVLHPWGGAKGLTGMRDTGGGRRHRTGAAVTEDDADEHVTDVGHARGRRTDACMVR
jgi:hypothetical protein